MSLFTPSHLGKWESLYTALIEGESFPLTEQAVWLIGNKPGVIAILEDKEPIYIQATRDISKTLSEYIDKTSDCDFRIQVAISEMGASPRTVSQRVKKGTFSERLTRRILKFRFTAVPATTSQTNRLAEAFTIVADPRLNGPTAKANAVIDSLPK